VPTRHVRGLDLANRADIKICRNRLKTWHYLYIIGDNFVKKMSTDFHNFYNVGKVDFQQNPCNISNLTSTLVPHYLIKFKRLIYLQNQGMRTLWPIVKIRDL